MEHTQNLAWDIVTETFYFQIQPSFYAPSSYLDRIICFVLFRFFGFRSIHFLSERPKDRMMVDPSRHMLSAKVWRKESNGRHCKNSVDFFSLLLLLLLQTTLSVKSLSSGIAVWFSQQNHRRILSLLRPCGSRRLKPHRAGPKVYPQSLTTTTERVEFTCMEPFISFYCLVCTWALSPSLYHIVSRRRRRTGLYGRKKRDGMYDFLIPTQPSSVREKGKVFQVKKKRYLLQTAKGWFGWWSHPYTPNYGCNLFIFHL